MTQLQLPLNFPELSPEQPLLPVRMINEFVHCQRLAYLEWVQGEWAASAYTVEGTHAHRRVDRAQGQLPLPTADPASAAAARAQGNLDDELAAPNIHARSVELCSAGYGLIGRLDVVEVEGNVATPSEYKKGRRTQRNL